MILVRVSLLVYKIKINDTYFDSGAYVFSVLYLYERKYMHHASLLNLFVDFPLLNQGQFSAYILCIKYMIGNMKVCIYTPLLRLQY